MLGPLRFRLTALFLAVVPVFGLASIALAVRLFQDVTHTQSVEELRREATGLASLYAESALRSADAGVQGPGGGGRRVPVPGGGPTLVGRRREGARVRGGEARARNRRRALLHRGVALSG